MIYLPATVTFREQIQILCFQPGYKSSKLLYVLLLCEDVLIQSQWRPFRG